MSWTSLALGLLFLGVAYLAGRSDGARAEGTRSLAVRKHVHVHYRTPPKGDPFDVEQQGFFKRLADKADPEAAKRAGFGIVHGLEGVGQ